MFGWELAAAIAALPMSPSAADLSCILSRVPAEARVSVVDEALLGRSGETRRFFDDAARACMGELSWPMPYATRVWRVAIATALAEEAESRLQRNGISPSIIRAWRDAQSMDLRRNVNRQSERSIALYRHLQTRGLPQALVDSNAVVIGGFIEALRTIEVGGDEGS